MKLSYIAPLLIVILSATLMSCSKLDESSGVPQNQPPTEKPKPSPLPSEIPEIEPEPETSPDPQREATFEIRKYSLSASGCKDGVASVATFDFSKSEIQKKYQVTVFAEGIKTLDEVRKIVEARGQKLVAIVNAGFFTGGNSVSYFKSALNQVEHPRNSARSPRACGVISESGNLKIYQSTVSQYEWFKTTTDKEIYCAGPQLIENGKNVWERQECAEQFRATVECRGDTTDPGVHLQSDIPRTASCMTSKGEYKLFAFISDSVRCGATAQNMTKFMLSQGCIEAMNHDGGGSAKVYLNNGKRTVHMLGIENRAVASWVGILEVNR